MGDPDPGNPKKRSRSQASSLPEPPARRNATSANSRPPTSNAVYLNNDLHQYVPNERINDVDPPNHAARDSESDLNLLTLPFELLTRILRYVGDIMPFERSTKLSTIAENRSIMKINKRNLLQARQTCSLLRGLADHPEVFASALLLQFSNSSQPAISSLTINQPSFADFRHTSSICILLDAPKDSAFDFKQIPSLLRLTPKIRYLQLVRRSSTYEAFMKSPVLVDLTPIEMLVHETILDIPSVHHLESLSLVNVIVRPSIISQYRRVCSNLSRIEIGWGTAEITQRFDFATRPQFQRQNESSLVSLSMETNEDAPNSNKKAVVYAPSSSMVHLPFDFVSALKTFSQGIETRYTTIDPREESKEEQELTHLRLSGPTVLMLRPSWISKSLRHFSVDASLLSDLPLYGNFNTCVAQITRCRNLSTLSIRLGAPIVKQLGSSIDITRHLRALPELPNLVVLESDIPIEARPSDLGGLMKGFPKMEVLDLVFLNPSSLCSITTIKAEPSNNLVEPTSGTSSATAVATNRPSLLSSSAFPFSPLGILPKANLAGLFAPARLQSQVSLPNPAGLSSSPSPAPSPCSSSTPDKIFVKDGLMGSLSMHCPRLNTLRLSFDSNHANQIISSHHPSFGIETEDLSALNFPCLRELAYNVGTIRSDAFGKARVRFPALRSLDLSGCKLDHPAALSSLHTSQGISHISLRGVDLDPRSLTSIFESSGASKSVRFLDLRLAPPHGLDASHLQRIGHSCSNLSHLFLSVSRDTTLPMQTFTTLIRNCKRLKVIHFSERSSISTAVTDMIQRSGVQVLFS